MSQQTCSRCLRLVAPDESLVFDGDRICHLDCRRPRKLTYEERVLVFRYCFGHAVAKCVACEANFRHYELGADVVAHRTHLCPRCRVDLTDSVRGHLYSCAMLPDIVRLKAREVRNATRKLVTDSHQLVDRADMLMREIDATLAADRALMQGFRVALAALRQAMQQVTDAQFGFARQ